MTFCHLNSVCTQMLHLWRWGRHDLQAGDRMPRFSSVLQDRRNEYVGLCAFTFFPFMAVSLSLFYYTYEWHWMVQSLHVFVFVFQQRTNSIELVRIFVLKTFSQPAAKMTCARGITQTSPSFFLFPLFKVEWTTWIT